MPNHPNRSRIDEGSPSAEDIAAARNRAGLTQAAAGALVHSSLNTWHQWEGAKRRMHPAIWELFQIKTGMAPVNG